MANTKKSLAFSAWPGLILIVFLKKHIIKRIFIIYQLEENWFWLLLLFRMLVFMDNDLEEKQKINFSRIYLKY